MGSFIRTYPLDELPQLLNVRRGDMTVMGPRPEQPTSFRELKRQVERYAEQQIELPGACSPPSERRPVGALAVGTSGYWKHEGQKSEA